MSRPHIEFIFAQALDWQKNAPLSGRAEAAHKLLSFDPDLGELTALLRFPVGWSGTIRSDYQEELYVLDGELSIAGEALSRDGYFRVPAKAEHGWAAPRGAVALVMLNVQSAEDEKNLVAIDTVAMPWDRSGVPVELDFMGIMRKALFVDPDTGWHRTWLLVVAPQIVPAGTSLATETHGCCEEVFMLSGDITGPQGAMTPGAYFWRPPETFHGPYGSRNGGMALSRFRHGRQTTIFHDRTLPFSFDTPYRPDLPPELVRMSAMAPEEPARF